MRHSMQIAVGVVCALVGFALASAPSRAGIGGACEVKATPDGFVAVRAAPTPRGALVARARPGEIVEIVSGKGGAPVASGVWRRVRHFPGEAMPASGAPGFDKVRAGWMNSRLIDGCG